jgi:hypothetical protein
MPTRTPLARLALLLALLAPPAQAADAPPRLNAALHDTRWQPLPTGIGRVFVGPDDRIWCELDSMARPRDLAQVRRQIEREFAQPNPQIAGATPLLFEPTGRAWFYVPALKAIVAYDGKTWIEHRRLSDSAPTGGVPNHGQSRTGSCNLAVAGTVFFPDLLGVEQFDGRTWSYQAFYTQRPDYTDRPLIEPEPDGKGVVAILQSAPPQMWRWRDGKWARAADPVGLDSLYHFAPAARGCWTLSRAEFRFQPYDAGDVAVLRPLVRKLDHADPSVRDAAATTLTTMGPSVLPTLEKVLADDAADFPERATRLQSAMIAIRARVRPDWAAFGDYRVRGVHAVRPLPDRTTCLAADDILAPDGQKIGPGLILRPPDAAAPPRVLRGANLVQLFDYPLAGPIAVGRPDAPRLWLPRARATDAPATLIDLRTGATLATFTEPGFSHPLAARAADAALFVATGESRDATKALFTPAAPDDRDVLPAHVTRILGTMNVTGSDGRLYATLPNQGLARYDGKTWTPLVDFDDFGQLVAAVAGAGPAGALLARGSNKSALILGDKVTTGDDFRALITAADRAALVAAFPNPTRGSYPRPASLNLFADAAGNLWLLDDGRLGVLAGDRWLDADVPLRAAGFASGKAPFAAAVGDGSKVYVTEFSPGIQGAAALGEVRGTGKDAALVFLPEDCATAMRFTDPTVRDADGRLWLPITWRIHHTENGRDVGPLGGRWATRYTPKGPDLRLDESAGMPALFDRSSTLWLAQADPDFGPIRGFNLWRTDHVVLSIPTPGIGQRAELFADRPGSVWAWTTVGLRHYVAKDPSDPRTYALARTYTPRDLDRPAARATFSPLGFVALSVPVPARVRTHSLETDLYVVPLPTE